MALFGPYSAEINSLNARLKAESSKTSGFQYDLGRVLLARLDAGATFDDPEINAIYAQVVDNRNTIANLNAELEAIQVRIQQEEQARAEEAARKKAEAEAARQARAEEARRLKEVRAAEMSSRVNNAASGSVCPTCGRPVSAGAVFCGGCGTKIEAKPVAPVASFCPGCGKPVVAGAMFCNQCGTKLQ